MEDGRLYNDNKGTGFFEEEMLSLDNKVNPERMPDLQQIEPILRSSEEGVVGGLSGHPLCMQVQLSLHLLDVGVISGLPV